MFTKVHLRILLLLFVAMTARMSRGFAAEESLIEGGTPLRGMADCGYGTDSSTDLHHGYARGVFCNNLDFYIAPDTGTRVRFLAELNLEPGFSDQGIGIDTERLQVGYTFSNQLTAWIGRFHTPMGFYVIAYHHGSLLQTAVEKPRFLDWEDHYGVLPVHTTGIWLNGQQVFSAGRLSYMAYGGNGSKMNDDQFTNIDMNMVHDDNTNMALGARLTWFFNGALDGLQVGLSALAESVDYAPQMGKGTASSWTGNANANHNVNDTFFSSKISIMALHAVYESGPWEFLNEFYNFENSAENIVGTDNTSGTPTQTTNSASTGTKNSTAGYTQLAYWVDARWAPYVRYEWGDFNTKDPFFLGQYNGLPYIRSALGGRYNLNDQSAVKLEFATTHFKASSFENPGNDYNQVRFDYAIRF